MEKRNAKLAQKEAQLEEERKHLTQLADEIQELNDISIEKKHHQILMEKFEAEKVLKEKSQVEALKKVIKNEAAKEYFPFTHGDFVTVKRQEEKERIKKEFQAMLD